MKEETCCQFVSKADMYRNFHQNADALHQAGRWSRHSRSTMLLPVLAQHPLSCCCSCSASTMCTNSQTSINFFLLGHICIRRTHFAHFTRNELLASLALRVDLFSHPKRRNYFILLQGQVRRKSISLFGCGVVSKLSKSKNILLICRAWLRAKIEEFRYR